MTLEQKVYALLSGDDTGDGPFGRAHERMPDTDDDEVYRHQLDLVDWGMAYGIAYGIARLEDPCEPPASVAYRAQKAAWKAWVVFSHGFTCDPTLPTEADKEAVGYFAQLAAAEAA